MDGDSKTGIGNVGQEVSSLLVRNPGLSLDDQLSAWDTYKELTRSDMYIWGEVAGYSRSYVYKWIRDRVKDMSLQKISSTRFRKYMYQTGSQDV